jgi:hypothetical protein
MRRLAHCPLHVYELHEGLVGRMDVEEPSADG